MTTVRIATLAAVACLSCGPGNWTYREPSPGGGTAEVLMEFPIDSPEPHFELFLDAATCSRPALFEILTWPRRERTLRVEGGRLVTLRLDDSYPRSAPYASGTKVLTVVHYAKNCPLIVSFEPRQEGSYRLVYEREGNGCRVQLFEIRDGRKVDANDRITIRRPNPLPLTTRSPHCQAEEALTP